MPDIEKRFFANEVRTANDGSRRVQGTAMIYAPLGQGRGPFGNEVFLPGAFSPVEGLDNVFLNFMHERNKPLARTQGGGLTLFDSEDRLRFKATLPETQVANDTLALVRAGVITGSSVEFLPEQVEWANDVRQIMKARLVGIGLVDVPAYKGATVEARAFIEKRRKGGYNGGYNYGSTATVRNRGKKRKQKIRPGAFTYTIRIVAETQEKIKAAPNRTLKAALTRSMPEISLMFQGAVLASARAGTLSVKDSDSALTWRARNIPDTSAARDLDAALLTLGGAMAVEPRFLIPPDETLDEKDRPAVLEVPENENEPDGPTVEEVRHAVLTHLHIVTRHRPGIDSPMAINESRRNLYRWL